MGRRGRQPRARCQGDGAEPGIVVTRQGQSRHVVGRDDVAEDRSVKEVEASAKPSVDALVEKTRKDVHEDFEAYYRAQELFGRQDGESKSGCSGSVSEPIENGSFKEFMVALGTRLPVVLRVPAERPLTAATERVLMADGSPFNRRQNFGVGDAKVRGAVKCDSVWETPASAFGKTWKSWSQREGYRGSVVFQELVSQLPPLCLDILPSDQVLDLCACPGNKTRQLVERVCPANGSAENSIGVVVAADIDPTRTAKLLNDALKRVAAPGSMALLHNAVNHPLLFEHSQHGEANLPAPVAVLPRRPLLYDKVLADVPCTGDGTCRKDRSILSRTWNRKAALQLFPTQLKILLRGLELLRTGGTLVYSTCSFNPIENEAVVAAALRATGGAVVLLDAVKQVRDRAGVKAAAGLRTWRVPEPARKGALFARWEEVPDELQSRGKRRGLVRDMFPPSEFAGDEADTDVSLLPDLQRCARLFPHDNDTGGFFVAVLQRRLESQTLGGLEKEGALALMPQIVSPSFMAGGGGGSDDGKGEEIGEANGEIVVEASAEAEDVRKKEAPQTEVDGDAATFAESGMASPCPRPEGWAATLHIASWYEQVDGTEPEWLEICDFYGLANGCGGAVAPTADASDSATDVTGALARCLFYWQVNAGGERRRLALVSRGVALRLEAWTAAVGGRRARSLPWARAGVFLFERLREGFLTDTRTRGGKSLTRCRWRPCEEGAWRLAPWLGRRNLLLAPARLQALLAMDPAQQQLPLNELWNDGRSVASSCSGDAVPVSNEEASGELAHGCGGVLVGVAGNGFGSRDHPDGALWIPGVLTPRTLRLFVEPTEARAFAELLQTPIPLVLPSASSCIGGHCNDHEGGGYGSHDA